MQPIVRPAARCAGPEHDIKLLKENLKGIERPVIDYWPFFMRFSTLTDYLEDPTSESPSDD
jgi:hypothetical protein